MTFVELAVHGLRGALLDGSLSFGLFLGGLAHLGIHTCLRNATKLDVASLSYLLLILEVAAL
jgi:hypothetical protein